MKKLLLAVICSLCAATSLSIGTVFTLQGVGAIDLFSDEVKVVFRNYDNTFLWKTTIPTGTSVVYCGDTPTRQSTDLYDYKFSSWDKSLFNITKDTVFHAQFYADLKEYKVTFQNWNHKDLHVDYVSKGGTAEYVGALPTRPSDEKYNYTFSGWDKPLSNIQQNEIITAQFDTEEVKYTVTFKNGDSVLYRDYVGYGKPATYKGLEPTKESANGFQYIFKGWDRDITRVFEDLETNALFDEVPIKHTVKFLNYDGELLYTTGVGHGQNAQYMGPTPYRPPQGPNAYSFDKWSKSIENVLSDLEVVAEYIAVDRELIVNYFNYDGTFLYTATCLYGRPAFYGGEMPYRPDDEMYTYEFVGWDRDVFYVTEDTTTYALFEKKLRTFEVVFINYNGSILYKTEVEYGKTAVYFGGTPVKEPAGNVSYKFLGWDKPLENITEDTVFVAQFKEYAQSGGGKIYVVAFCNYDGEELDFDAVLEGDPADYGWETPQRDHNPDYGSYYWTGWDRSIYEVKENMTVFAQYETDNYYIVTYRNLADELLYEDYVYKWDDSQFRKSSYKGELYDYLMPENGFLGWDHDLTNVSCSFTVRPIRPPQGD